MPNHSTNVDAQTSWEIHACETWSARQKILADSINDTARMARTTLSFFLFVAFYLFLVILASTDEQLLRGDEVTLPQVGIGISTEGNYFLGPLIFFYLHVQILFLLGILAQKIREFTRISKDDPSVTTILTTRRRSDAESEWNWLSAFAFVQWSRRNNGSRRWLPRTLSFISIVIIPILLLFTVDLSFVRYQSYITNIHHALLILDVISIVIFMLWISHHEDILKHCHWAFWVMVVVVIGGGKLFSYTQPPFFENGGIGIWNSNAIPGIQDKKIQKEPFDSLCEWTRNWTTPICRYIDVNGITLTGTWIELPDKGIGIRKIHINKLNLEKRRLRYALFSGAEISYVNFRNADLRGADFTDTELNEINLSGAELYGTIFRIAELWNAKFIGAKLHGANFKYAKLHDADFRFAKLYGANLEGAELNGADFRGAKLHGANLEGAELNGADFRGAKLHGANLEGAELNGANLRNAELYGANLEGVKLDGADLGEAKLTGSYGSPESWKFVWLSDITSFSSFFDFSPYIYESVAREPISRSEFIERSVDRFQKNTGMENIKIYWKEESVMKYEKLLEENIKENSWENPDMRPDSKDMIHLAHTRMWGDAFSRPEAENIQWLRKLSTYDDKKYWKNRAEWAADFACRNEYTARIILKRWMSNTPLTNMKKEDIGMARYIVIYELDVKKLKEKCFGLHVLPDDEWQEFLRSTRSRME